MQRPTQTHSAKFKAQVALEAIRGEKAIAEIAAQRGVHPNEIAAWKTELLENAAAIFGGEAEVGTDSAPKVRSDERLAGRVAIVTGAGTGVGQGIALAFARAGANVLIVGRTQETLQTTGALIEKAGARARILQGSITERETAMRAVDEAVATFGGLDVLVNNAQTFTDYSGLEETPEKNFRIQLESGFFGTLYFMMAAFPHLRERQGSVINIGSVAGVEGWATMAPYNTTKEAIRSLSRTASRDWGKYHVRVNVILPAAHSKIADQVLSDPQVMQAMIARIPLGYIGDAELDIGGVAVFLASDAARYVTGQTLHADGGM